jgi:hypothetical protein
MHAVGLGVLLVGSDVETERSIQPQRWIAHQPRDVGGRTRGIDAGQVGRGRLQAGGLDRPGVHEALIQIAQLAAVGVRRDFRQVLDDGLQPRFVLQVQFQIHAGIAAVGGDRGMFQPAAIGMAEEIRARQHGLVDVSGRDIDRRGAGGGGKKQGCDLDAAHGISP